MSEELQQQLEAEKASADRVMEELEQDIVQERPDKVEIPAKFKSVEELSKAYTELESYSGRQANDIGQLRKMTDQLLELKKTPAVPEKPIDVDSLLDDPSTTINSVIDKNDRLLRIEQQLQQDSLVKARGRFEEKHPDWTDVVKDQDFRNWVNSSQIRQSMFAAADQQYNYEVGDELFTLYKETRQAKAQESKQNRDNRIKGDLKDAATETGISGTRSAKIYKRADLVNLRVYNPEKWEANEEEFRKAYAEGRVR